MSVALLHGFDDVVHALFLPGIAICALLWFFGVSLLMTGRRDWRPIPGWPKGISLAFGSFAAIIFFLLATGFGIEWLVLRNDRPVLFSNVTGVAVDGQPVADPQRLVADLRKLPNGSNHHSHPKRTFRVALNTAKGPLTLLLERDSSDPTEYWVYDPAFRDGYLGKIHTSELNGR